MAEGQLRARALIRTSTKHLEQDTSILNQEPIVIEHIESRGWLYTGKYTDRKTGTTLERNDLKRALAEMKAGEYDVLVCKTAKRWGRTIKMLLWLDEFRDAGGKIVFLDLNMDTTTAFGEGMLAMMLIMGHMEARQTGELVRQTNALKRSRGQHLGKLPAGIVDTAPPRSGQQQLALNEVGATTIREVFERSKAGASAHSIVEWLDSIGYRGPQGGKVDVTGVLDMLRHPLYRDLLGADLFDAAQPRRRGPYGTASTGSFLLHRLLYNGALTYADHMPRAGQQPVMLTGPSAPYPMYQPEKRGARKGLPSWEVAPAPEGRSCTNIDCAQVDSLLLDHLWALHQADRNGTIRRDVERLARKQEAAGATRADSLAKLLATARRRLDAAHALTDAALAAGLYDRAGELDTAARVLLANVAQLEADLDTARQAGEIVMPEPVLMAMSKLQILRTLARERAWPELREIVACLVQRVDANVYTLKRSDRELHGHLHITWTSLVQDSTGKGTVGLWQAKHTVIVTRAA